MAYAGRAIDESGVPPEKRSHPEYLRRYLELQTLLTALNSIDKYCAHEAGHLIFFERAGLTQFEFYGPTMTFNDLHSFDDESKRYGYFLAAVRTPEAGDIQGYDDEMLNTLARAAVAGEVFNEVRQQSPIRPIDESTDFVGFDAHCRKALREDFEIGYDAKGRWRKAQDAVRAYLQDNANEPEIQSAIAKVRFGCFGIR